ncbi:MAG: hypothetical protein QOF78_630 [Phycisphaerales bacterium]|jgi:hypothetical protein|nr:hypothetical protein [Phycisphaerales bacterium]
MTADEFWQWFAAQEQALRGVDGQTVADSVEVRLREIDSRIGVEVSDPGDPRELIFTAWSQAEAFPAVRELVAAAPVLRGWQIIALKPPRGFAFGMNLDGLKIDASRIQFDPLAAEEDPKLLGVRFYVPGATDEDDERLSRALPIIIETGIGEEAAAQIDHMDFAAGAIPDEKALPIEQLLPYIQWHRRKHGLE